VLQVGRTLDPNFEPGCGTDRDCRALQFLAERRDAGQGGRVLSHSLLVPLPDVPSELPVDFVSDFPALPLESEGEPAAGGEPDR
jgi:hypothetical protein